MLKFKDGLRIIAIKNRLRMLPVYIKSNASKTLQEALCNNKKEHEIIIVIGDTIDYLDKSDIETTYRTMFELEPQP